MNVDARHARRDEPLLFSSPGLCLMVDVIKKVVCFIYWDQAHHIINSQLIHQIRGGLFGKFDNRSCELMRLASKTSLVLSPV